MASRKDVVSRARGRKASVKKPFPTTMVAGYGALLLVLGGIITYSAMNVGIGDTSSLKYAESRIDGLEKDHDLSANHVDGKFVDYPDQKTTPPMGGNHASTPQSCQVYNTAIASEHAVHSMEHGAVWVTYDPEKVKGKDLETLKKEVDGNPYRLMSPYPGLSSAVSLQAWGERLSVSSVSDERVKQFLDLFTQGPQTQEPNGTCVGITDDRTKATAAFNGTAPAGGKAPAATPAPTASGSAAPSASASAAPKASASPSPTAK